MATAQERLAVLVEWVQLSSARRPTPLGRDWIEPGPWAVFVPQALNLPPTPTFDAKHLPLWIPSQQAMLDLPPFNVAAPTGQGSMADRLKHLLWKFQDGLFSGALLALTEPQEPLQSALDRQLPSLDLGQYPALFLPVWSLPTEDRTWALAQLPVLRQ